MKLTSPLKSKLEKTGTEVVKLLQVQGFQAFFVGGIVRNMILKRSSDNIDIATNATPEQVEKVLEQAGIMHKPVGREFGSILAMVNGFKIEITTFRAEGRYSDNRHPDQVEYIQDYAKDAKRRDFTINALYLEPITKELFDPINGSKDLKAKLLRFVGNPKKRIDEDALRMMRAVRLATQLGFKLEQNSFSAIKTRAKYIQGISGERVKAELDKILLDPNRVAGVRLLDQLGLLRFILPELEAIKNINHASTHYHLEGSVFEHSLLAISNIKELNLDLIYAVLFHDIGKDKVMGHMERFGEIVNTFHGHGERSAELFKNISDRLKFSSKSHDLISNAIRDHMVIFGLPEMKPETQVRHALKPDFVFLAELGRFDDMANKRRRADGAVGFSKPTRYLLTKKLIKQVSTKQKELEKLASGDLIMQETNLDEGPMIGKIQEQIKIKIVLGEIRNLADAKKFLKNHRKRLDKR